MQEQKDIIDCYDKTAENYADYFINELDEKTGQIGGQAHKIWRCPE